jgi:hypothetical protein
MTSTRFRIDFSGIFQVFPKTGKIQDQVVHNSNFPVASRRRSAEELDNPVRYLAPDAPGWPTLVYVTKEAKR